MLASTLHAADARAQTPAAVRPVAVVDLDRYAGDWFEIARFPNRFQRQCTGDVRASYARRADGRIDVVNRCRTVEGQTEARGVARIVDERTSARLKVRFAPAWLSFLPFIWGDYWIIGLAPDYTWAVVGDPGRTYLWILARTPRLDDASLELARTAARDNGFDVTRLVLTPQALSQHHPSPTSVMSRDKALLAMNKPLRLRQDRQRYGEAWGDARPRRPLRRKRLTSVTSGGRTRSVATKLFQASEP